MHVGFMHSYMQPFDLCLHSQHAYICVHQQHEDPRMQEVMCLSYMVTCG